MKKKFTFLALIASFNLAANYAHPITPAYFKLWHLDSAMFGYAFAVMSLGMFLGSPFFGELAKSINARILMAGGSIGYSLAQVLFALGHTPGIILWGRLLAGIACGAFFVGALTYIANTSLADERGANLTLNATVQTVFGALGYFIGGIIGSFDLMWAFSLQIVQLFVTGILFYFLLVDDLANPEKLNLKKACQSLTFIPRLAPKDAPLSRLLWGLLGVSVLTFLGYTAFDQSFNYYLKDVFDLSSSYNGTFKGAVGLISLVANMTFGMFLVKKTDLKRSTPVILGACALFMGAVLFSPNLLIFFSLNLVFYAFYAVSVPMVQDLITNQATPKTQSTVLGFYQASQSFGRIIGAFIAGILYDLNNLIPFSLGAVSFLIAALVIQFLKKS
ncbi:MFS transporter [Ligilactobacillus apodemi]|uniref:MFS transporter n=1 Tax=Ligilactobacillus apodemi TaxID=307126 RepID=UPI00214C36A9|nr:MFS transporter [Ligilactobacillus apodemi]MCR1901350.1 MFS transporter [Ligilactobacillus apodemi]